MNKEPLTSGVHRISRQQGYSALSRSTKSIFSFRRIVFFLICLFAICNAFSQSQKQYIKKADSYFEKGDFYNAIHYYETALKMDSTILSLCFSYAESNRFVNNYPLAERFYYKVWTRDSKNEYPQSQYWLGMMQKSNGKYRDAEKSFDRYYRRFARDSANYFTKKSRIEKEACVWAQEQIVQPQPIWITHLDSTINSIHADFAASLSDTTMCFSAVRGDSATTVYFKELFSKIYFANGKDSIWKASVPADSAFYFPNSDVANPSFSKDGKRFYFTVFPKKKKSQIIPGIYFSELQAGHFQKPQLLEGGMNSLGSMNTHPASTMDSLGNERLFFASDRAGGMGKFDIWYCKANKEGKFGPAINAGYLINTKDDEVSPFFNDSSKTLFFSSTYFKGMGGFDIVYTHWNDSLLTYDKPENPGYPLNTAANELYYSNSLDSKKGYFSSNRSGSFSVYGETCCNDIYFFMRTDTLPPAIKDSVILAVEPPPPPPVIKEDVVEKIKLLVPLTLYFNNDEPDPKTTLTTTKKNYEETYISYSNLQEKYKTEYSKGLKGSDKEKAEKDIENFFRDQLTEGYIGLEKFAALMLENLEDGRVVSIGLKGYCSPLASTDYNKSLAKRRIASLKNYFMTYGNGTFLPYMSELPNPDLKGKIIITEEDIGELQTTTDVSDNLQDQRNSVYSRKAMLERKIQIIAVSAVAK